MMAGRLLLGTTLGLAQPFSQLPLRNIQRSFHSSSTLADRPNYRQLLQGSESYSVFRSSTGVSTDVQ